MALAAVVVALGVAFGAGPPGLEVKPAGPWREVARKGGVVVEAQLVEGTELENLRAIAVIDVPPDVMLDLMWGDGTLKDASPGITTRELLVDKPTERVYYETIRAPLVSARDYGLRVVKEPTRLVFRTVDPSGKPKSDDVVRMTRIVGESRVEPISGTPGSSRVVHVVFSDPAGAIPAWIAKGSQRDQMVAWMEILKARAADFRAGKRQR